MKQKIVEAINRLARLGPLWSLLADMEPQQFLDCVADEIIKLRSQRDELLAAAKAYLEREPTYPKTSYLGEMRIKLEAVIEKVEKNA